MRRLATLIVAGVCACAGAKVPETAPVFKDTTFEFNEQPAGTEVMISGTMRVIGRAVAIDAQPGPCRNLLVQNERSSIYQCGEVTLMADLSTSEPRLSYQTSRTVREYKTTCVRYETNSNGQRVCAQSQSEQVDRKVSVSGTLHLTPQPASP